jgi:hypothetical protein
MMMDSNKVAVLYNEARVAAGKKHGFGATNLQVAEELVEIVTNACSEELLSWKHEPFPYDPGFGATLVKKLFRVQ